MANGLLELVRRFSIVEKDVRRISTWERPPAGTSGGGGGDMIVHALDPDDGPWHFGNLKWIHVNKTGASLADLPTRNYSDLQNRTHVITGADHSLVAPQWSLVGIPTTANELGTLLARSVASGPVLFETVLKTDSAGKLELMTLQVVTEVITPKVRSLGALTLESTGGANDILLNPGHDVVVPINKRVNSAGANLIGYPGNGWGMWTDITGKAFMETTDLTVRGRMNVYELLIRQIRSTNGSLMVSSSSRVKTVALFSGTAGAVNSVYEITVENETYHGFLPGDLIRAMRWKSDGDGGKAVNFDSKMTVVTAVDLDTYRARLDGPLPNDVPQPGFDYVRHGSTSDVDRQGMLYLTSDDTNSPYMAILNGVASWADWDGGTKLKGIIGNLTGSAIGSAADATGKEYGMAFGTGWTIADQYVKVSNRTVLMNKITLHSYIGSVETLRIEPAGNLIIGKDISAPATTGFTFTASTGILALGRSDTPAITFNSNTGASYFSGLMTIATSGEIRQGTGTLGTNFTGLRIWNQSNVGRIAGYFNNTMQWAATTGGYIMAGGVLSGEIGNVNLSSRGLTMAVIVGESSPADGWVGSQRGVRWYIDPIGDTNPLGAIVVGQDDSGFVYTAIQAKQGSAESTLSLWFTISTAADLWLNNINSVIGIPGFFATSTPGGGYSDAVRIGTSGSSQTQAFEIGDDVTTNVKTDWLPDVSGARSLGVTGQRWKDLWVDTLHAGAIEGGPAMSGQTWKYDAGDMFIESDAGASRTLYLSNPNAGFTMGLNVEGNIAVGGTVDNVDVQGLYNAFITHTVSNPDAHHNKVHDLVGPDHSVSSLTIGHVLTATAPNAFSFQPISTFSTSDVQAIVAAMATDSARIDFSTTATTFTADIKALSVANSFLATMAANTVKGSVTGIGAPVDLSVTQLITILNTGSGLNADTVDGVSLQGTAAWQVLVSAVGSPYPGAWTNIADLLGDGLQFSSNKITTKLANPGGLTQDVNGIKVALDPARGITLASNLVGLNILSNGGLAFTANALGILLPTNSGLTLGVAGLAMGTPTDLSVASTTSSVTTNTHTHRVIWSSNPAATSSLLGTDASGYLTLVRLTLTGQLSTPLIVAPADLTLTPVSGNVIINNNLSVQILTAATRVTTPAITTATGDLTVTPATGIATFSSIVNAAIFNASTRVTTPLITTASGDLTVTPATGIVTAPIFNATTRVTTSLITSTTATDVTITPATGNVVVPTLTATVNVASPLVTTLQVTSTATNSILINPDTYVRIADSKVLRSSSFLSGIIGTGYGWAIDYNVSIAGKSTLEVDFLTVRGGLNVAELVLHKIRATNGNLFVSAAFRVSAVTLLTGTAGATGSTYRLTPNSGMGVTVAQFDLLRAQRFMNGTQIMISDLRVDSVAGDNSTIDVTLLNQTTPNPPTPPLVATTPAVDYDYARIGNTTNTARQGGLYLSSDDNGAPYMDAWDGITAHSQWGTPTVVKLRVGKITGMTSVANDYGIVAGSTTLAGNDSDFLISTAGGNAVARIGKSSGTNPNMFFSTVTGNLSLRNGTTDKITFKANGDAEISGVIKIGTLGGIWQGTSGTFASPNNGLKIWSDSGVGRLATYNTGVVQVSLNDQGQLTAGGGTVRVDANGISITASGTFSRANAYNFINPSNVVQGGMWYEQNSTWSRLLVAGNYNWETLTVANPTAQGGILMQGWVQQGSGKTAEVAIEAATTEAIANVGVYLYKVDGASGSVTVIAPEILLSAPVTNIRSSSAGMGVHFLLSQAEYNTKIIAPWGTAAAPSYGLASTNVNVTSNTGMYMDTTTAPFAIGWSTDGVSRMTLDSITLAMTGRVNPALGGFVARSTGMMPWTTLGWKRIARFSGAGTRGQFIVQVINTGGNVGPFVLTINVLSTNSHGVGTGWLQLTGGHSSIISSVRVTSDATWKYLEINNVGTLMNSCYIKRDIGGWDDNTSGSTIELYSTEINGSGTVILETGVQSYGLSLSHGIRTDSTLVADGGFSTAGAFKATATGGGFSAFWGGTPGTYTPFRFTDSAGTDVHGTGMAGQAQNYIGLALNGLFHFLTRNDNSDSYIRLGYNNQAGDRNNYIDFHTDSTNATTATTYTTRIIRAPAANGALTIANRGTGMIVFQTNASNAAYMNSANLFYSYGGIQAATTILAGTTIEAGTTLTAGGYIFGTNLSVGGGLAAAPAIQMLNAGYGIYASTNFMGFRVANLTRMTITNVGGTLSGSWDTGPIDVTGNLSVSGTFSIATIYAGNGSAAAPSHSFSSASTYGMFYASSALQFSTSGAVAGYFNASNDLYVLRNVIASTSIMGPAGTVTVPSITFSSATQTGFYSGAADRFRITIGGDDVGAFLWASNRPQWGIASSDSGVGTAGPFFSIGRNTNATGAASYILMLSRTGGSYRIWVDNAGTLRIWNAGDPTSGNDTQGTVVGSQVTPSSLAMKNILGGAPDSAAVLEYIAQGAAGVRAFSYKEQNGVMAAGVDGAVDNPVSDALYKGELFSGIVTDYAPRYGMDNGKVLNVINAIGDLMIGTTHLHKRIENLEKEVSELKSRLSQGH